MEKQTVRHQSGYPRYVASRRVWEEGALLCHGAGYQQSIAAQKPEIELNGEK